MPSDSLDTTIWAPGNQRPTPPSIWYVSPVAGSLSGRGMYWALTGDARSTSAPVRPANAYKRIASLFGIKVRVVRKGGRTRLGFSENNTSRASGGPLQLVGGNEKRYHGGHGNEPRARIGFVQQRAVTSVVELFRAPARLRLLRLRLRQIQH